MEDAWWDVPSGAGFEAVGLREVGDLVVALGEVFQAFEDLFLGGAGGEAEEGEGEIRAVVVELGREIICLGLAALAGEQGVFVAVVDVVGQRVLCVPSMGTL